MLERKKVVIETWLPEELVIRSVRETEGEAIEMIKKMLEEENDGTKDASGDRVETNSGSEEE